jgi:transcriptional regulator GlxA family with amidase domain
MNLMHESQSTRKVPRRIAFFLFPDVEEQDFVGPWECFGLWRLEANGPEILTVAENADTLRCAHGLLIKPEYSFSTCPAFEAIVIPGGKGRRAVVASELASSFLRDKSSEVQDILTVCTGSLILNDLHMLHGLRATTHWEFLHELKQNHAVTVEEGARFVRDGRIWTSGGVFSGVDLALAYIDSFKDAAVPDGSSRRGDAGKVQLFAEYLPERRIYSPELDLSQAPAHIRRSFS